MRENKGLDYQVGQESASVRIIPEDIFMKRDLIPVYGFFSSCWRAAKEVASFFVYSNKNMEINIRRGLRIFPRLFEWEAIGFYNAGIAAMAESLYLMLKN